MIYDTLEEKIMTREQTATNAPNQLTEKLVDQITSYNRLNAFPNNDPSKVSDEEYDRLKDQSKYITDDTLIGHIDKIEFFIKEIRKHIIRKW